MGRPEPTCVSPTGCKYRSTQTKLHSIFLMAPANSTTESPKALWELAANDKLLHKPVRKAVDCRLSSQKRQNISNTFPCCLTPLGQSFVIPEARSIHTVTKLCVKCLAQRLAHSKLLKTVSSCYYYLLQCAGHRKETVSIQKWYKEWDTLYRRFKNNIQ